MLATCQWHSSVSIGWCLVLPHGFPLCPSNVRNRFFRRVRDFDWVSLRVSVGFRCSIVAALPLLLPGERRWRHLLTELPIRTFHVSLLCRHQVDVGKVGVTLHRFKQNLYRRVVRGRSIDFNRGRRTIAHSEACDLHVHGTGLDNALESL